MTTAGILRALPPTNKRENAHVANVALIITLSAQSISLKEIHKLIS
jgi:hypothetical protein